MIRTLIFCSSLSGDRFVDGSLFTQMCAALRRCGSGFFPVGGALLSGNMSTCNKYSCIHGVALEKYLTLIYRYTK